jgi:hypothetical protein
MDKKLQLVTTEPFLDKKIKVFLDEHGWYYSNYTGKKYYGFSSDAIVDAKKNIRKKMKKVGV